MAFRSEHKVSWNPFRVTGTPMPSSLLLMCKILAVAILFTDHRRQFTDPFLPFVDWLDVFHGSELYVRVLRIVAIVSAVDLIFNRWVRFSAFTLGACFLLAVLSSKAYFGNNKTFTGLLLVLASVSSEKNPALFLRLQFAVLYFGAALNKLLLPDWQSGLFFEHWAGTVVKNPVYLAISKELPPLVAGQAMCIAVILVELFLAIAIFSPRMLTWVIWTNVLFQVGLLEFNGDTFNLFFFASMAVNWAFIAWPTDKILVLYDGDCGFCEFSKRQVERVDFDRLLDFQPYQLGAGRPFGITDDMSQKAIYTVDRGLIRGGFRAFRYMLLFNPAFWIILTAVIAQLAFWRWTLALRIVVGLTVFVLSPLFFPIGEWGYQLIARNRHRLMPGATCGLDLKPRKERPG